MVLQIKKTITHGANTYHLQYDVGDTVEWTSQANGSTITKRGKVLAFVMPQEPARELLPEGTAKTALQGDNKSANVRVLVEVPRGGKSDKMNYYCPRVTAPQLVKE